MALLGTRGLGGGSKGRDVKRHVLPIGQLAPASGSIEKDRHHKCWLYSEWHLNQNH